MADQRLTIVVEVQNGRAAAAQIEGVATATTNVGKSTEETAKKTRGLKSALGGIAAGFAAYKAFNWVKGAVNTTAELAKNTAGLQRITGMDAQTASGWVATAKERGVQAKALNLGFITLAKNISSASQGSKASSKALQQLGLDANALKQQTPTVQISMLADSFKALPAGVDKAALAQKLFGRQAQSLLPLLNQGGVALSKQIGEMGRHTGVTDKNLKSQLALVRSQRELHTAMLSLQLAVGTALIPILQSLAAIIAPIAQAFANLMQHSGVFRVAVVALTGALGAYIIAMQAAKLANISFMATAAPWLALVVGIGLALVLLYQKCAWFRNAVGAALGAVISAFRWIKQAAVDAFNWIKTHWPLLVTILAGPLAPFVAAIILVVKNFRTLKSVATSVANAIGSAFSAAFHAVVGAAKGAINLIISGWNRLHFHIPGFKVGPVHFGGTDVGVPAIPQLAAGGTVTGAGMAIVGERGPELLSLPGGATVAPLGAATIHTHVFIGPREIAHAMGDYVAGQQAAR